MSYAQAQINSSADGAGVSMSVNTAWMEQHAEKLKRWGDALSHLLETDSSGNKDVDVSRIDLLMGSDEN